jgi:membrane-associated protease RseP (regulator of RpoE activity)
MITFFYIVMIFLICIWSLTNNGVKEIPNYYPAAAIILIIIAVLFVIMLGGLYGGHIIFMCVYNKTTNEALKRSEKYGYKFK